MAILLVRHGETLGNRNRIVQTPDVPLSDHGQSQATRLARRLAASPIAEIWTSPQTRARMTAAALEEATGLAAREHALLEERSFGAIRGTPYAELGFDLMADDYEPPAGESWAVFHERVDRIWSEVEAHWRSHYATAPERGHFVIVSHGLVCRSLIERRLLPGQRLESLSDDLGRLHLRNTALTVIEPREASDGALAFELPVVGCIAHLDAQEPEALGAV